MLKYMEKLLNSRRARCLSLQLHSEQMDGPQSQRRRQDPCAGQPFAPPPRGRLPRQHPEPLLSAEPLFSHPIRGMWALERQSHSGEQSDGNRRGSDRLAALSSQCALGSPPAQDGKRGGPLRS